MKETVEKKMAVDWRSIVRGLILSTVVTLVLVLVLGLVCFFTKMSDSVIPTAVFVITVVSLILGGMKAAKGAQRSGFLHGALVSLGYYILLLIASVLLNGAFQFGMHMVTTAIGCLAAGMVGGIFGINTGKKQSRCRR
jgi:putative membrane protein (TIGR04086 family)